MDEEGDIADGPNGPMIFTGGRWVPMGQSAAPQGRVIRVPNPRADQAMEINRARLGNENARLGIQRDQAEISRQRMIADLYAKGLQPDGRGGIEPIPNWQPPLSAAQAPKITAKVREDAIEAYNDADALERIADELQRKYEAGPGATKGIGGWQDYLPTGENKAFDDTAFQARGYVKRALGFTGGEGNTLGEIELNYGPYLPEASNMDERILNKIEGLRALAGDSRKKAIGVLGGVPDANGRVSPFEQRNPFDQASGQGIQRAEGSAVDALTGATRMRTAPAPEVEAFAYDLFKRGKSLNAINEAVQAKFPGASPIIMTPETYRYAKDQLKAGKEWNPFTATRQVPMSAAEKFSGSDTGAFLANLGNAGSLGAVGAMAPDQLALMRSASPKSSLFGEVLGSIAGAKGLGTVSGELGKRLTPELARKVMGSGGMARGLAVDTAYGAARGGIEDGTPEGALMGGLTGQVGSFGGQLVGEGLGRAVSGVTSSPSVALLRQQGVTPTLGQIMRGRAADNGGQSFIAGGEEAIANTPFAGTLVNTRRGEALADANTAAYRTVGGPQISGTGDDALAQLTRVKNQAYDDFAQGVSLPTREPKFIEQVAAINPGLGADKFGRFMETTIIPALDQTPEIGGKRLQELYRTLAKNKSLARKDLTDTMENGATADALQQFENALTGLAARNAPGSVPKLKQANRINRGMSILDEAAGQAAGEPGQAFTGAQLKQAIRNDASRFSGGRGLTKMGKSDLAALQRAMEAVLPNKTPPTGVNTAPILAAAGLASGVAGQNTDNDLLRGLGMIGLLATPYTKRGAKWTAQALLDRPEKVLKAGKAMRKKKGIFGSAGAGAARDYDNKAKD